MSVGAADNGGTTTARGGDLVVRVVSAVVLAFIALLAAILGAWAAAFVLAIVTAVVHLEWANLTDRSPFPAAVFTVGLVFAITMVTLGLVQGALVIVGLAVLAAGGTMSLWRPIGVAYASVLGVGLLLLRLSPEQGLAAVLIVLGVVWATDTAAFFAGRTFGGAKLWPEVSPNKTWSGAVGGLAAGLAAGVLLSLWLKIPVSAILLFVFALLSVSGQAGDLFESWVKRRFGAKDSSQLVPGHGGLMDRVDSLTFASGVAVLIGWLHGGENLATGLLVW